MNERMKEKMNERMERKGERKRRSWKISLFSDGAEWLRQILEGKFRLDLLDRYAVSGRLLLLSLGGDRVSGQPSQNHSQNQEENKDELHFWRLWEKEGRGERREIRLMLQVCWVEWVEQVKDWKIDKLITDTLSLSIPLSYH